MLPGPEPEARIVGPSPIHFSRGKLAFFNFGDFFLCACGVFQRRSFAMILGILCWPYARIQKEIFPEKMTLQWNHTTTMAKCSIWPQQHVYSLDSAWALLVTWKNLCGGELWAKVAHLSSRHANPWTPSAHEKWRVLHPQNMGYNPKKMKVVGSHETECTSKNRHFHSEVFKKNFPGTSPLLNLLQRLISAFSFCQKEELPPGTIPLS